MEEMSIAITSSINNADHAIGGAKSGKKANECEDDSTTGVRTTGHSGFDEHSFSTIIQH